MKVLFVSHNFNHMGKFSGYEQLGTYLKSLNEMDLINHRNRNLSFIQNKIVNAKLSDYDQKKYGRFHHFEHYKTEYEVVKQSRAIEPDIIHLAYLEDSLGYISDNRKKIKAKIVATSHQPPSWWLETNKNTDLIKCLDALIVLSTEAKSFFESFLPGKVFFIPHGINTIFFAPQKLKSREPKKKKILFVGNWLRDFSSFSQTVSTLNEMHTNDVEFDIVFPRKIHSDHPFNLLLKYANVHLHQNVDDHHLLSLYQNTDLLLLPLTDCTANNALLEAAACEVPIITNLCGGVGDYLSEQLEYLTKNSSPDEFLDKINFIFEDSNKKKIKSNSSLQREILVRKFSWEKIALKMATLYKML